MHGIRLVLSVDQHGAAEALAAAYKNLGIPCIDCRALSVERKAGRWTPVVRGPAVPIWKCTARAFAILGILKLDPEAGLGELASANPASWLLSCLIGKLCSGGRRAMPFFERWWKNVVQKQLETKRLLKKLSRRDVRVVHGTPPARVKPPKDTAQSRPTNVHA